MLITVILPTYNRAHLLGDAITSVLNQTYTNFEVLVIDDHSDDETEKVVRGFKDPRVKYFKNKRAKGAQGARNTGLYEARGEWIAMLDSDDIWLPKKLEKQVDYLNKSTDRLVGISTGSAKYDFENQKVLDYKVPEKRYYTLTELLYKNYLSGFSTFFFKKEAALTFGGFDERFLAMQDIDFYISMSKTGEIHTLPEVLAHIRTKNNDRITKDYNLKLSASRLFYQKYRHLIKGNFHLENRAISRFLVYGWKQNKINHLRYIHWVIIGLFIDPSNLRWVIAHIIRQ